MPAKVRKKSGLTKHQPNFFSLKISGLKSLIKETADKRLVFVLLQFGALALGIILGATAEPTPFIYGYYSENAKNYYRAVMYAENSCFGILLERIITNFGYFAVYFALGLVGALFPISAVITAYRGFILAFTVRIFALHFGITGVLIACFLILPQNIVTTAGLIFCSVTAPVIKKRCGAKKFFAAYLTVCIVAYAVSLIGALAEALVLGILLRPMNFFF